MDDRKISALAELTAPVDTDYLPIVDVSEAADADKNKRVLWSRFGDLKADGSVPLTADWDVGAFKLTADAFAARDYIELFEAAEPAPGASSSRLFAFDQDGETRLRLITPDSRVLDLARDATLVVRNASGGALSKGDVVYVSGQTGTVPDVSPARADSATTMDAIAVLADDIADTAFGIGVALGIIESIDTSAFSVNDVLYVSPTTAGELTATKPTAPNLVHAVGRVLVSSVGSGQIQVNADVTAQLAGSGAFTSDAQTQITPATPIVLDEATGDEVALTLSYTTNKATSGNDTGLLISMTDTASPGTSLPLDIQVGGSSKAEINNAGLLKIASWLETTRGLSTVDGRGNGGFYTKNTGAVGWSTNNGMTGTIDLMLVRDAAKVLKITDSGGTAGGSLKMDLTTEDRGFINFAGTADADATSAISTLTTSGATTHHIQVEINGVTAWIAASTTDPT